MKKRTPPSSSKRPTATLDLKAKDVSKTASGKEESSKDAKSDTSKTEAGKPADKSAATTASTKSSTSSKPTTGARSRFGSSARSATGTQAGATPSSKGSTTDKAKATDNKSASSSSGAGGKQPPKATAPKPAKSSSGGGFVSHLLSTVAGAVLGILGLSYASNQDLLPRGFELGAGNSMKQQVAGIQDKLDLLQNQTASDDANSLKGRIEALGLRLQQAESGLKGSSQTNQTIGDKVSALEATMRDLENAAKTGKGGRLAGLAAVTKELKRSNTEAGKLNTQFLKMREEQSSFRTGLATVRSKQADFNTNAANTADKLAKLENRVAQIGADAKRPPDISAQITPVLEAMTALKAQVGGLMNREQGARKEGRNIALALSLGELGRAVEQGAPFANELARVKPHAPEGLDLAALESNATTGLITIRALTEEFDDISNKALAAESTATSGSFLDQLVANAKSVVQVRPTGLVEGDHTGAILSRMEYKLQRRNLAGALQESQALKGEALNIMQPWLGKARSRLEGDTILRTLEDKIRTSLAGVDSK